MTMTKAEILGVWKELVKHMTDQGAVVPFAHEIASRVRNELLARIEAAEKERDNANAAAIGVALQAEALQAKLYAAEKERNAAVEMLKKLDRVPLAIEIVWYRNGFDILGENLSSFLKEIQTELDEPK